MTYCPRWNYYWINFEKGGSSNFWNFFTGINSFQTASSDSKSRAWTLLEKIRTSWQGLARNKISKISEIYSRNIVPDPL